MFSSRLGQGVEALFPPERYHRYIFGFGIEEDKGVGVLVLAKAQRVRPGEGSDAPQSFEALPHERGVLRLDDRSCV